MKILKILTVLLTISFVSACKIVEEPMLSKNNETVPLPDKFFYVAKDFTAEGEDAEKLVRSPTLTRIYPNQFKSDEGTLLTFEKLQSEENYWIVETNYSLMNNPDADARFLLLVEITPEVATVIHDTLYFGENPLSSFPEKLSTDDIQPYFSALKDLEAHQTGEEYFFIFDADDSSSETQSRLLSLPSQVEALEKSERERSAEAKRLVEENRRKEQEQHQREAQEEAERREQERLAQQQTDRNRLLQQQNELAKDKEKRVISFSDGTELSFCISESTIEASTKAANEQNYFVYINRLDSLNNERLCTRRLSMGNIEEMTAAVEYLEKDDDTGRVFMIGSIARNYFTNCPPCDNLRPSDRLYFVVFNDVGGEQYGWKGLEQFIVNNRTVGGIMDFLLSE